MNDQTDIISQWIIKGDHDLGTAKLTYLHIPEYLDTATFHCQQATEKYLKAYLIYLSIPFKYTHDLVYLLDIISTEDNEFSQFYDLVSELQGYAIEVRYPNESIFLTKEQVERAIAVARQIREFTLERMKMKIDYHNIIDS
jgi:HEPN domain-containing protein